LSAACVIAKAAQRLIAINNLVMRGSFK